MAVAILMLINLIFYGLVRWARLDTLVKDRVSTYLSEALSAEVVFGDFSFNDKQLDVNNILITDKNGLYTIRIRQVFIEYNLPLLLFFRFSAFRAVEDVKIFEPEIILTFKENLQNSASRPLPGDISRYFQRLQIYNGSLELNYHSPSVQISTRLDSLNLEMINNIRSEVNFSATGRDSSHLSGDFAYHKGFLRRLNLLLSNYQPDTLQVKFLDELTGKLDLELNYTPGENKVTGYWKDFRLLKDGYSLLSDSLFFTVDNDSLNLDLNTLTINNRAVSGRIGLNDIRSRRELSGQINIPQYPLTEILPQLQGMAGIKAEIQGELLNPLMSLQLVLPELTFRNQQVTDLNLSASASLQEIELQQIQGYWRGNFWQGYGRYTADAGLSLSLDASQMRWEYEGIVSRGDMQVLFNYSRYPRAEITVSSLEVKYLDYLLNDLELEASLEDNLFQFEIARAAGDFMISGQGRLSPLQVESRIDIHRFELSRLLNDASLPFISGQTNLLADADRVSLYSNVRVFDLDYGKLDGRFQTSLSLDLRNNLSLLSLKSSNAKYNFEPLIVELTAAGTLDSLQTQKFHINNEIFLQAWLSLNSGFDYGFSLQAEQIKPRDYLKYFISYYLYDQIKGKIDLSLDYRSHRTGILNGFMRFREISFGQINPFWGDISWQGNSANLTAFGQIGFQTAVPVLEFSAEFAPYSLLLQKATGNIQHLDLQDLIANEHYRGNIYSSFTYHGQPASKLDLDFRAENVTCWGFNIEHINLNAHQSPRKLTIDSLSVSSSGLLELNGQGSMGYNILNGNVYPDRDSISLHLEGDLLKIMEKRLPAVVSGNSATIVDLQVATGENGLEIRRGHFWLNDGDMKLKDQLEPIDKIRIDMMVENDLLQVEECRLRMGEGYLRLKNEISGTDRDFQLGNVQLGIFLLYTSGEDLLFHLPLYMPGNSVSRTRIRGRDKDELIVYGPFEDISIIGDIHFSNGSGIYPSQTENLLKFISRITETEEPVSYDIPLKLDLMLHFDDNIRYVTYPLNLLVDRGSYLHLQFDTEKFFVPDAYFTSENGYIDIFGTRMAADYVQVRIDPYDRRAKIRGSFYKKAPDGTMISLEVSNQEEMSVGSELYFDLNSSNADDSRLDMLALLRYGRRQNEISPSQQKSILQDEVIQLAGLGIESAVIDPLISPVENWIRQLLRLDFFHLQTNLIQNIFSRYSSDETEYILSGEGEKVSQSTTDLFLNNLSVGMGKYLSRNLFLDYELQFQKPRDLAIGSDMGIYHNFTLRYDLPYNFGFAYSYHILPFDLVNNHEFRLEKSFRFW